MIYSGFKHEIDNGKSPLSQWCKDLKWQGQQVLPEPYTEITRDEWLAKLLCGHEVSLEEFYDGFNIPNEDEWFGGWSAKTTVFYTYGLVALKMSFSPNMPDHVRRPVLGKGIILEPSKYTHYVLRFFQIGCEHTWVTASDKSYMFHHASICTKCGQETAVDSSG